MKYLRFGFPLLYAIAPILLLYSHNIDLVEPAYLIRPALVAGFGVAVLFCLIRLVIRSTEKTAIITSLWTIGFYSFGHVFQLLPQIKSKGTAVDLYYPFLVASLIFIIGLTALIVSTRRSLRFVITYLSAVGIMLVCFPVFAVSRYSFQLAGQKNNESANDTALAVSGQTDRPDIYYIVLDGYARADILNDIYQADNSEFISFLRASGFYVADESTTNYPQTYFSIASTLNYEYIDPARSARGVGSDDRSALRTMIENSGTYAFLKAQGYQFVTFPSGWVGLSQHLPADIRMRESATVSEFENILLATTPISRLFDRTIRENQLRSEVLYTLDHLPDLGANPAATFTYTHILSPHPPFIFTAEGSAPAMKDGLFALDGSHYFAYYPDKEQYRQQYRDQLAYISQRATVMIKELLARSPQPPIIIIQSDHGPGSQLDWERPEQTNMKERFAILNAYYVPANIKDVLYPSITPVNTFRLLFNKEFGQPLDLLPDRNYFNTWTHPWDFIEVTDSIKK